MFFFFFSFMSKPLFVLRIYRPVTFCVLSCVGVDSTRNDMSTLFVCSGKGVSSVSLIVHRLGPNLTFKDEGSGHESDEPVSQRVRRRVNS